MTARSKKPRIRMVETRKKTLHAVAHPLAAATHAHDAPLVAELLDAPSLPADTVDATKRRRRRRPSPSPRPSPQSTRGRRRAMPRPRCGSSPPHRQFATGLPGASRPGSAVPLSVYPCSATDARLSIIVLLTSHHSPVTAHALTKKQLLSIVMAGEATGGREELMLLGFWSSPFVMRARFVLNLKGLPYEYVEEDLFNKKSENLLASNPVHKKVPVLIHNGKPVCESMVIVQYIDEAFPSSCPRVLPCDPHERAAARFWAANVDDKLFSTWIPVYNGRTVEDRVEAARQLIAVLETFERAFRECSNGKAFFGRDSVGLVDVVLGSFLGWLNASEAMCGVKVIDAAKTPLLAAWAERFGALDGVKEVIPDTQRLVEYNMMRRAHHGLPLLLPHH